MYGCHKHGWRCHQKYLFSGSHKRKKCQYGKNFNGSQVFRNIKCTNQHLATGLLSQEYLVVFTTLLREHSVLTSAVKITLKTFKNWFPQTDTWQSTQSRFCGLLYRTLFNMV